MVRIKCFEVSDDIFDKILYDYEADIKIVDSVNPYIGGYHNKKWIYYDNKEFMILREYILDSYCNCIQDVTLWKQCRIRRVENMNTVVQRSIDGQSSWEFMINLLEHYYTWDEIVSIFKAHEKEYDEGYIQYHYTYPAEINQLIKFKDCYKYDINGAHTDALVEMFPKASKSILKLYEERKEHPINKQTINFFVGMIKHKGYDKTYNWIVQRTTNSLYKAMDTTGGYLIYANTDGYVISSPKAQLEASKELGKFKLEYSGEAYVYRGNNYWIIQTGDEIKGSALKSVRKYIDLRQGKVVSYDRKILNLDNDINLYVAENIKKEIVKCQDE